MKPFQLRSNQTIIAGVLLTLPASYFVFISVTKYFFGLPFLFDASYPFLETLGIKESVGFNVNLLIVFGPVLALLLNTLALFHLHFRSGKERIILQLVLKKSWSNILLILCSGIVMLCLFTYLAIENCNCF